MSREMSKGLIHEVTGTTITVEQGQDWIRQTFERTGRFIVSSRVPAEIGEIRYLADLPLRVMRTATYEEAVENAKAVEDLWGSMEVNANEFYYDVVVAD